MITREEFDRACEAVWSEIEYQNTLPRRTDDDEAKDIPGFLTLLRRYIRTVENDWADNHALIETVESGRLQVPDAVHGLRKLAAIAIRAMTKNGVLRR